MTALFRLSLGLLLVALALVSWLTPVAQPLRAALARWSDTDILTVDCGSGNLLELCRRAAEQFEQATTYTVQVMPSPSDPSLHLDYLQELIHTEARSLDVYLLDSSWVGQLASGLAPVRADTTQLVTAGLVNDTVAGQLLALPLTLDLGILYFNQALLDKHGVKVPDSYQDLERSARYVRLREDEFLWGYGWITTGDAVTDWLVERLAAEAAGTLVEQDGAITVLNQLAIRTFSDVAQWAGDLAPGSGQLENSAQLDAAWRAGQVLFRRGWASSYISEPQPAFASFAALPAGDARRASVLGGWQLAVSRYSRHQDAAQAFIAYLTSADIQTELALAGYLPARQDSYLVPQVRGLHPLYSDLPALLDAAVLRPSTVTGEHYAALSGAVQRAVASLLNGQDPKVMAQALADALSGIKGSGW